jgi:hypothetical protein
MINRRGKGRSQARRIPVRPVYASPRSTQGGGSITTRTTPRCRRPQIRSEPEAARFASRHSPPGLIDGESDEKDAVTSVDRTFPQPAAAGAPGNGWAAVRTTKRRIQSRTVVGGSPRSALIRRKLRPRAEAVSAAPMTSTRSSRRSSTRSGSTTWVRPQPVQRPRRGRSRSKRRRSRTQRIRAKPQSRSRPEQDGQRSFPAHIAVATRAAGQLVTINACASCLTREQRGTLSADLSRCPPSGIT